MFSMLRPAPAVNRLVVIADHAYRALRRPWPAGAARRTASALVSWNSSDQDVPEAPLVMLQRGPVVVAPSDSSARSSNSSAEVDNPGTG